MGQRSELFQIDRPRVRTSEYEEHEGDEEGRYEERFDEGEKQDISNSFPRLPVHLQ